MVGGDELVAAIAEGGAGAIGFDKCLATAEMATKLGRVARVNAQPRPAPSTLPCTTILRIDDVR